MCSPRTLIAATMLSLACIPGSLRAAVWYVDGSVSGFSDGTTWQTAWKRIQHGIDVASHGDTVIVAPGIYLENVEFKRKIIALRSMDPSNRDVVSNTVIDGNQASSVVTFDGIETEGCLLSGFTVRNGRSERDGGGIHGHGTRATITNNVIADNSADRSGGGLFGCRGMIRTNTISGNSAESGGGGLNHCDGVIQGNIISGNSSDGRGGGLQDCHGTIRNNIIHSNSAAELGGGLYHCLGIIHNNTIYANSAPIAGGGMAACYQPPRNCVIWGNTAGQGAQLDASGEPTYSCIQDWTGGGEGNINLDPGFVDAENGDFWLRPHSPCIDAGFNSPDLPETDVAGMHRIMFGGKSLSVDMGAYEFYINRVEPVPGTDQAIFTWSSLADRSYSIFYTDDLFNWHTAIDNFPSAGYKTTSWIDDGSLTGLPPLLAPRRFYRILENP